MVHKISSGVSSFSGCLEFSPVFFQISVSPSIIIPLAMSEVRFLENLCLSFLYL